MTHTLEVGMYEIMAMLFIKILYFKNSQLFSVKIFAHYQSMLSLILFR